MNNYKTKAIRLSSMVITSLVLFGCALSPDSIEKKVRGDQNIDNQKNSSVTALEEPSPNIIFVHRKGKDYEIRFKLDMSNEDIQLNMALDDENLEIKQPQEEGEPIDEKSIGDEEPRDSMQVKEPSSQSGGSGATIQIASKHLFNAQSLFYKNQYSESISEVDKAIAVSPELAIAHALKGSIYYQLDQKESAKESWQKALELDSEMTEVRQSLERLQ